MLVLHSFYFSTLSCLSGLQNNIYSVGIHEECESSVRFQVLVSCLNSTFMKCVCSSACLGSAYVRGICTGSMWDTLSRASPISRMVDPPNPTSFYTHLCPLQAIGHHKKTHLTVTLHI